MSKAKKLLSLLVLCLIIFCSINSTTDGSGESDRGGEVEAVTVETETL